MYLNHNRLLIDSGTNEKKREKGTKAKQHCSRGDMAKSQRFQESISANRIVHALRTERNTTTASLLAINNNVSFVCVHGLSPENHRRAFLVSLTPSFRFRSIVLVSGSL